MSKFIKLEGYEDIQNPYYEVSYEAQQLVSEARNANATLTATKIGDRQVKLDLIWKGISREELQKIVPAINNFYVNVTFYNPMIDEVETRQFYFGDFNAKPLKWDRDGSVMIPTYYSEVTCNLIQTGV